MGPIKVGHRRPRRPRRSTPALPSRTARFAGDQAKDEAERGRPAPPSTPSTGTGKTLGENHAEERSCDRQTVGRPSATSLRVGHAKPPQSFAAPRPKRPGGHDREKLLGGTEAGVAFTAPPRPAAGRGSGAGRHTSRSLWLHCRLVPAIRLPFPPRVTQSDYQETPTEVARARTRFSAEEAKAARALPPRERSDEASTPTSFPSRALGRPDMRIFLRFWGDVPRKSPEGVDQ